MKRVPEQRRRAQVVVLLRARYALSEWMLESRSAPIRFWRRKCADKYACVNLSWLYLNGETMDAVERVHVAMVRQDIAALHQKERMVAQIIANILRLHMRRFVILIEGLVFMRINIR